MNIPTVLGPVRGLWPQKVRTRLAVLYAALFFAAGSALLVLTYGLVASSLPTRPPSSLTISSQEMSLFNACTSEGAAFKKGDQPPPAEPKDLLGCKQVESAYYEGTAAGMQEQRQQTLGKLLRFWLVGLGLMTVASGGLG